MTDSNDTQKLQDELDALNAQITKQGSQVRQLKKDAGSADDIGEAVKALQALKIQASSVSDVLDKDTVFFNRKVFDDVTLRKMFIVPSFEIHGGVKGLFDLGPPATALKVCTILCTSSTLLA
jgi:glycyl-tRNA synthetase